MSQVSISDLSYATKLLKIRLSYKLPLGVNIVCPITAEEPGNINEHPGRFVGFFIKLSDGEPSFVWLSRTLPDGFGFSHVHVYYVNRNLRKVADEEIRRFRSKKLPPHVQFCVVNLVGKFPRFLHLSVLLQSLEVTLGAGRLSLATVAYLGIRPLNVLVGDRTAPWPRRCHAMDPLSSVTLWDKVAQIKYEWIEICTSASPKRINPSFDVMKIFLECYGHCIFGIHYKSMKTILLLIPHLFIFQTREHFKEVEDILKKSLPANSLKCIGSIRYYGSPNVSCNSDEILKACLLALRYPLSIIKQAEVEAVINDDYFAGMMSINDPASQFSLSQESIRMVDVTGDGSQPNPTQIYYSQLGEGQLVSDIDADMSVVASELSTQATHVMDTQEILREVQEYKAKRNLRADLVEALVPPTPLIEPYNDIREDFLQRRGLFYACLEQIIKLWQGFCTVRLLPLMNASEVDTRSIYLTGERFVILPLEYGQVVLVIVIDCENNEWGYLNPYLKEPNPYSEVLPFAESSINALYGLSRVPIALTSQYHSEYSNMHILMGAFYLGKLFKYAIRLPKRIFYQETHYRHFCWNLCEALQASNAEYNVNNGLVKATGYLREGAMHSMGSPIQFKPAVVSAKECPFCLKRGFGNIGSHMMMAHGNGARTAREMRNIRAGNIG